MPAAMKVVVEPLLRVDSFGHTRDFTPAKNLSSVRLKVISKGCQSF